MAKRKIVGLVALIVGALLLLFGIIMGTTGTVKDSAACGSVFSPAVLVSASDSYVDELLKNVMSDSCHDALASKGAGVWTMIGFGIALIIGGTVATALPERKDSLESDEEVIVVEHDATVDGTEDEVPAPSGLTEQLERLAGLHTSGALSDEEYAEAKRRVLAQ